MLDQHGKFNNHDSVGEEAMKIMCKMGNGNGRCKNDGKDCSHGEPHEPFVACDDPCERARLFNDKVVSPCQPYVIADPVQPAPDRVTCPACGKDLSTTFPQAYGSVKCEGFYFRCPGCGLCGPTDDTTDGSIAKFKRIRIDTDPLVCPRCNGPVEIRPRTYNNIDGFRAECCSCVICGTFQGSEQDAESEFRKLSYAGGAK